MNDIHNSTTEDIQFYKSILDCIWPGRGGWDVIDYHGASTYVCPLNTGRGIGTETFKADNVFRSDDIWFGSDADTNCAVVYDLYLDA